VYGDVRGLVALYEKMNKPIDYWKLNCADCGQRKYDNFPHTRFVSSNLTQNTELAMEQCSSHEQRCVYCALQLALW